MSSGLIRFPTTACGEMPELGSLPKAVVTKPEPQEPCKLLVDEEQEVLRFPVLQIRPGTVQRKSIHTYKPAKTPSSMLIGRIIQDLTLYLSLDDGYFSNSLPKEVVKMITTDELDGLEVELTLRRLSGYENTTRLHTLLSDIPQVIKEIYGIDDQIES